MEGPYTSCCACGMDFLKPSDHAFGDINNPYCNECVHADGSPKCYEEVHLLIADDLVKSQGIDRVAADQMAREIMARLPAWKA